MRVAVIPARGGSKRIPRKNIREFMGKPMIAHSISAAIESKCFDRIVVSTDDQEIADIARTWGAEIPFMRPRNLSDDYTATVPVIKHAVKELKCSNPNDYICCLYATAPFVTAEVLAKAASLIQQDSYDYVFPITSFSYPIQRALTLAENGDISMIDPDMYSVRSQDLTQTFHDVGQFYFGCSEAWLNDRPIFLSRSKGIEIPRYTAQDIDDEEDWIRAEMLLKALSS